MTNSKRHATQIWLGITLIIMLSEVAVMAILAQWSELPATLEWLVDAVLLAVFVSPAIYLLVYQPMRREVAERRLAEENLQLALDGETRLNKELQRAKDQLLESEKLISMGQIAAGVAHEINNPVGYVGSNLRTLNEYCDDIVCLLAIYEEGHPLIQQDQPLYERLQQALEKADIQYLRQDIHDLISESREGIERVKRIVQDLKDFSRSDEGVTEATDLNVELERTLNIVHNELKYHTDIEKQLGELPPVVCVPSQINQVFLNILVNAGQAIKEKGTITIRSEALTNEVHITISDTGTGMTDDQKLRLFEPFYTTKPRGKGTGLGLSVSWGIINKHGGHIEVDSTLGEGTSFHIYLPLTPPDCGADSPV